MGGDGNSSKIKTTWQRINYWGSGIWFGERISIDISAVQCASAQPVPVQSWARQFRQKKTHNSAKRDLEEVAVREELLMVLKYVFL
jgi:hypothetical protein